MSYLQKKITQSVFRAYDIRGIIGEELDIHAFYSIGLAIACRLQDLGRTQILLGEDGRLTSPDLAQALKQGLLESGIDVVYLGAIPTPVMYYATHTTGIDSGLMVTGSHNPANYNGIKMVLAGTTLVQEDIDKLFDLVHSGARCQGLGQETQLDIKAPYLARLIEGIQLKKNLKVVVDCGNGIAGPLVIEALQALQCEVIPLYCEVDGHFPNHHPDPSVEANLADLKTAVASHQADLGLAFDGDGDRLGLITNQLEMICPDRLMMLYAKDILQHHPGATIVFDVKCSSDLAKVISQASGKPIMCPTGHSIVKGVMKSCQALLAGEMSGHLFFKDRWYGFDDALYSACRLLEIVSASPVSIAEQFALIPNSMNTPELKIPIPDAHKFDFMRRFTAEADFPEGKRISLDGLRVEYETGWGLLRASNTTPCLVARFEAIDSHSLLRIQEIFKTQILRLDAALAVPF